MYEVNWTNKFGRDIKRCQKQGKNMDLFKRINEMLIAGKPLPFKNRDHALTGNWVGHRECHIKPDWLLIYKIDEENCIIEYTRTGSHAELFNA